MDEMRSRFTAAVSAALSAAPASAAKDDMVEELSDNLYRRFLDMTGAGMGEEEAFRRAMDGLGDVDELLGYLGAGGGQARRGPDAQPGGQGEIEELFNGLAGMCRAAVDQTRQAVIRARDAVRRRTTWENRNGSVRVHFDTRPGGETPSEPDPAQAPGSDPPGPDGWQFDAELNRGEGRFFAGGGPKQNKDVVYGFGYDKAKGGFYTQWGEDRPDRGPQFSGEDAAMTGNDDGTYSVTALRDLRGLNVQTSAGDVAIHMSEAPDAGVIIDGDVDDLDVTCSADGVLTIREGRTASSSFFSRMGLGSADVELFLPRRYWEDISVSTASGDVTIDRDGLDVGRLSVRTASGDLSARLFACGRLEFRSAGGDLEVKGDCAELQAETMSGDLELDGQFERAALKTASGDINLLGSARHLDCASLSGDVDLSLRSLPEGMELSSKSGDCSVRLPDMGPFTLRCRTTSGELDLDAPIWYEGSTAVCGDGSGAQYNIRTVSGDILLRKG